MKSYRHRYGIKEMKGKRRVVTKSYFNSNQLHLLQIYERNLKQWVTVNSTTNLDSARKWEKCVK